MGEFKWVNPKDIIGRVDENPYKRGLPPVDERLARLCADVQEGKAPSWRTTARLVDLAIHHPETLAGARAVVMENPSLYRSMAKDIEAQAAALIVYRNAEGQLVMFDDYVKYVVAERVGREWVNVTVLGEAAPEDDREGGA